MSEPINLRRLRKAKRRADEEKAAETNRVTHGTSKHLRKRAKAEKSHQDLKVEAHKLDSRKPSGVRKEPSS